MSQPFLRLVADHIQTNYKDTFEKLCIVLPGKRASLFLKQHLAMSFGKTIWVPDIITAEDLIRELSGLKILEEIDLICYLYESYRAVEGANAEPFESFAKWGNLILQDFNEIDRYLADPAQLYENLKDIKVIENWSLGAETLTEHQSRYLRFMSSIGAIYRHYTEFLLSKGYAYQGLAYRIAVQKAEEHNFPDKYLKFIFCGFNALNESELRICKILKQKNKIEFLWDIDEYYLKDDLQEAGMFLRKNLDYFSDAKPSFAGNYLLEEKQLRVISVPKQIGQAQVVKQSLQQLLNEGVPMDRVAVVLANEKLLWPVLLQLPSGIESVNITMEYPLRYTSAYGLVELFMQLQIAYARQNRKSKMIYHSDLVNLLRHPLLNIFIRSHSKVIYPNVIISEIKERNLSFITASQLKDLFGDEHSWLNLFFSESTVNAFCEKMIELLEQLTALLSKDVNDSRKKLELEFLHILIKNFNRLVEALQRQSHFQDIQSFRQLFQQTVGTASAPFIGEPLRGLQIMGVLETRTLDFDHVILVNANEGILPSGKAVNSFIPNDLKRAFGLPLYEEKDAVYAYHFYRLLQRTKDMTITYDSETDTFGKGERSRFVTQVLLELPKHNKNIRITEMVASYPNYPSAIPNEIQIAKNESVLASIRAKAENAEKFGGLSPSGLISFKECPLRFYFRYGAGLKETTEIEESAEASTFGNILHESLENLYKPMLDQNITVTGLEHAAKMISTEVDTRFDAIFGTLSRGGKLVLQQEVIKVYAGKLIENDLRQIKKFNTEKKQLRLSGLEIEYTAPINVIVNGNSNDFFIKGKMDRLDKFENKLRVVDYKSSVKENDKFTFDGFELLFEDLRYNKQLQLFIYAWLLYKNAVAPAEHIMPCIIPFKVFAEEPKYILGKNARPLELSPGLLYEFEEKLKEFISRIFDTTRPFVQSTDESVHQYCPYNSICNL